MENWIRILWEWEETNKLNENWNIDWVSEFSPLPRDVTKLKQLEEYLIAGLLDPDLLPITLKTDIPKEIGKLISLKSLDISVENIRHLPKEIGELKNLTSLAIENCTSIIQLPEEIGNLSELNSIRLIGNDSLLRLPANITRLCNITDLNISDNKKLKLTLKQKMWIKNLKDNGCYVRLGRINPFTGKDESLDISLDLISNLIQINGNWKAGWAFDIHTIYSEFLGQDEYGHDRYNNIRSEMGELVYQLKYQHDSSVANRIIDLLQDLKIFEHIDIVVPIPPSNKNRANQPVYSIATEFGKRFGVAVYLDVLEKSKGSQELKGITNPDERQEALKNSMRISKSYDLSEKNILLIDDLYRSGATLKAATELLYSDAGAKNINVLTMTKTRSNR